MIIHDTFTLERTYDAPIADVWRYWTDPELRQLWFRAPNGWEMIERSLDLKVGGHEVMRGRMPTGTRTSFRSTFHVIAPEQHIVSAYIMHIDDKLFSMTLATMELAPDGERAQLRYTEQSAYFCDDTRAPAGRRAGTSWHLDNLGDVLRSSSPDRRA